LRSTGSTSSPGGDRRDLALVFFREVAAEPLLPLHDPYLQEAFEHVGH
jgi:hypothetical protein